MAKRKNFYTKIYMKGARGLTANCFVYNVSAIRVGATQLLFIYNVTLGY